MPLHCHEICLLVALLFLLVIFLVYLYVELNTPEVVIYEKPAIGSYHTRWCRDLNED